MHILRSTRTLCRHSTRWSAVMPRRAVHVRSKCGFYPAGCICGCLASMQCSVRQSTLVCAGPLNWSAQCARQVVDALYSVLGSTLRLCILCSLHISCASHDRTTLFCTASDLCQELHTVHVAGRETSCDTDHDTSEAKRRCDD